MQAGKQKDTNTDWHRHRHRTETDAQTDRQTNRQTDRQTDRRTDRQTDRQRETETGSEREREKEKGAKKEELKRLAFSSNLRPIDTFPLDIPNLAPNKQPLVTDKLWTVHSCFTPRLFTSSSHDVIKHNKYAFRL